MQALRRDSDSQSLPIGVNEALLCDEKVHFVGYLHFHMNMVTVKAKRQQFFVNFIGRYYGLSRRGTDVLSRYGYLTSVRYADGELETQKEFAKEKVR